MGKDIEEVESFSDSESIRDERIQDFEDDFESAEEEANAPKLTFTKPQHGVRAEVVAPQERSIDRSKGSQEQVGNVTQGDEEDNMEEDIPEADDIEDDIEGYSSRGKGSNDSGDKTPRRQEAATTIQSVYRGHKERVKFKQELQEKKQAAIKIQSQFRGFRERKSYKQRKEENLKQNKALKNEKDSKAKSEKSVKEKGSKEKGNKERKGETEKDEKTFEKDKGKAKAEDPPKIPSKTSNLKPIDKPPTQIPKPQNTSVKQDNKLQPIKPSSLSKPPSDTKILQKTTSQVSNQAKMQASKSQSAPEGNINLELSQKIEKLTSELQMKDRKLNELQENIKILNKQLENFANQEDGADSFTKYQKIFSQEQKLAKEKELLLVSMLKNFELASKTMQRHKEDSLAASKDKKEVWRGELVRRNQLVMEKHKHIQTLEQTIANMKVFQEREIQSHLNRIHDLESLVHKLRREKLEMSMLESKVSRLPPRKLNDDLSARNHVSSLPPIRKP